MYVSCILNCTVDSTDAHAINYPLNQFPESSKNAMQGELDNMKADFETKIQQLTTSLNEANTEIQGLKEEKNKGKVYAEGQEAADDLETRNRIT